MADERRRQALGTIGELPAWDDKPPHEVVIQGICWARQTEMCVGPDDKQTCGWCDCGYMLKRGNNVMPPANA